MTRRSTPNAYFPTRDDGGPDVFDLMHRAARLSALLDYPKHVRIYDGFRPNTEARPHDGPFGLVGIDPETGDELALSMLGISLTGIGWVLDQLEKSVLEKSMPVGSA